MSLKKFKPTTPGQRHKINSDYKEITTRVPEKSLVVGISKNGGRNNDGRMTMRYIGGGHKQKYRIIDFKRDKEEVPATVSMIRIELLVLLYCSMQMERSVILLHQTD